MRETGSSRDRDNHSITISGTEAEIDMVRRMLTGAAWLVLDDDGPRQADRYLPVPDAIEDPLVPPKWTKRALKVKAPPVGKCTEADLANVQRDIEQRDREHVTVPLTVRDFGEPDEGWHSPSYIVRHLVGYNSAVTTYQAEARKLYAWGFECLRSRRGPDGKFWELWYLPGDWCAKGKLAHAIKLAATSDDMNKQWMVVARAVMEFLCRNCSFGCADVTVQRAAMIID